MAWTAPTNRSTSDLITSAIWNADLVANLVALRAGGIAIASQAANDILYASSATQFARAASANNGVVITSGAGVPSVSTTIPAATQANITAVGTVTSGVWNAGAVTSSGTIRAAAGSAGAPAFSFSSDTDSGLYSGGSNDIELVAGGIQAISIAATSGSSTAVVVNSGAFGAGHFGAQFVIGRNTTGGGSAGMLVMIGKGASGNYLWVDASASPGMLRISISGPTESGSPSDTSGTVVGDQTSWHGAKANIVRTAMTPDGALAAVVGSEIYDFEYAGDGYQDADGRRARFTGFVGYDRRDWFLKNVGPQQGPCLNDITIPGYFALAFKALASRVAALEARS